jgi:hypothetical protein
MTGHGRASERTANGANQSANGGYLGTCYWQGASSAAIGVCRPSRTVRLGEVAARPHLRGKGGRAAAGEPDRALQVTAGGNSGPRVW